MFPCGTVSHEHETDRDSERMWEKKRGGASEGEECRELMGDDRRGEERGKEEGGVRKREKG